MPIDPSIYFQQQTPDIVGGFTRGYESGMNMKQMADQRARQEATTNAFAKGVKQNPDGSVSYDFNSSMPEMAKANPEMFMQMQAMQANQAKSARDSKAYEIDQIARTLDGVSDQSSFDKAKSVLNARGLKTDMLGPSYDPVRIDQLKKAAIPYQQQINNRNKQIELGYKKRELEAKEKSEANKLKLDSGKLATDLRTERSVLPTTKDTMAVSASYNKIQSAANKPSAAGDLALIFNFMKMLDPGSVVRESEFKSAEQARAWMSKSEENGVQIPAAVKQGIQKLKDGQFLLPEQRQDFVSQAEGLYQAQIDIQNQIDAQFASLAREAGIDPQKVLLNFSANTKNKSNMDRYEKIKLLNALDKKKSGNN